jgi:hypothetical protein
MTKEDANIFQQLKRTDWKQTLWINFLRALCAIPAILLLGFISDPDQKLSNDVLLIGSVYPFLFPFFLAPILFIIVLFITAIFNLGEDEQKILVGFLALLLIAGGDPIVFLLHKVKPQIVPVVNYPFIWFKLIIWVDKNNT